MGARIISFVIPAHNEGALLASTVRALREGARSLGLDFEIIVVDDASTDDTADIARAEHAAVVAVRRRNIAAVRNAGARAARGDVLVFVDADTIVPVAVLRATMHALAHGAVAGGARQKLDAASPLWARLVWLNAAWLIYVVRLTGGCFLFARRAVFDAVGGFDEAYYVTEEIHLARALKAHGKFVVVRNAVITSGRKFSLLGFRRALREVTGAARHLVREGWAAYRRPEHTGIWYDAQR